MPCHSFDAILSPSQKKALQSKAVKIIVRYRIASKKFSNDKALFQNIKSNLNRFPPKRQAALEKRLVSIDKRLLRTKQKIDALSDQYKGSMALISSLDEYKSNQMKAHIERLVAAKSRLPKSTIKVPKPRQRASKKKNKEMIKWADDFFESSIKKRAVVKKQKSAKKPAAKKPAAKKSAKKSLSAKRAALYPLPLTPPAKRVRKQTDFLVAN